MHNYGSVLTVLDYCVLSRSYIRILTMNKCRASSNCNCQNQQFRFYEYLGLTQWLWM